MAAQSNRQLKASMKAMIGALEESMKSKDELPEGPMTLSVSWISPSGVPVAMSMCKCTDKNGNFGWHECKDCHHR